jgi:hypothetical protein
MKKVFYALVILVVGLVGLDFVARAWVESQVANATHRRISGVASVDVSIDSFPFLGRLAAAGQISHITMRLDEVAGQPVDVRTLRVDVHDLELSRSVLLGKAHVQLTGVRLVRLTAVITQDALRKLTRADIQISDGRIAITGGGHTVTAEVSVVNGRLRFKVDPLPAFTVPLPTTELLPCHVQVTARDGELDLTCTTTKLPPIVVRAVGSVDLRNEIG